MGKISRFTILVMVVVNLVAFGQASLPQTGPMGPAEANGIFSSVRLGSPIAQEEIKPLARPEPALLPKSITEMKAIPLGRPANIPGKDLQPVPVLVPANFTSPEPAGNGPIAGVNSGSEIFPFADGIPGRARDNCWVRGEYGFWWLRGSQLPPLVTASPPGTPLAQAGVLGAPGTTILIGDERVNDGMRSGGQLTLGSWLDQDHLWGIEAGFLFIGSQGRQFAAGSDGSQIIARPYTDANTGTGAAELVSFPGLVAGNTVVSTHADPLYGANILLQRSLCRSCNYQVNLLGGYRYLTFGEDLTIQEKLTSLEPATQGTVLIVRDGFSTRNEFHGGDLGLQADFWRGNFSLGLLAKAALGNLHRHVQINGSTEVAFPGFPSILNQGGLLALSSNSGTFTSNKFVCIPEVGVTAGWRISEHLYATLGYTFLWWPDVVRPGDQIDRVVNPNLLPPSSGVGPARPAFNLHESDLWVQGLRLGVEVRR